jgi:hypothetical protein
MLQMQRMVDALNKEMAELRPSPKDEERRTQILKQQRWLEGVANSLGFSTRTNTPGIFQGGPLQLPQAQPKFAPQVTVPELDGRTNAQPALRFIRNPSGQFVPMR